MRVLVDSSTLIALANIGELDIINVIFGKVYITTKIREEILKPDYPETEVLKKALNGWIEVLDYEGEMGALRKYGLDAGEESLFFAAGQDDRLVLDEANARRFAESQGLRFTGLIGLIVAAEKSGKVTRDKALEVLDKLARGDFRISAELYVWACGEMG